MCDREAQERGLCKQSIAYDAIKQRRNSRAVKKTRGDVVAAGGTLADYVPFYFANRSPMLLAIHKGHVAGYEGGQAEVIYLVSSAETVAKTDLVWCFTDGHAVEGITEFFDSLDELPKVDWGAVETWRWGGRWLFQDPDVKRRKQAEFLVHRRVPWALVEQVAVINHGVAQRITEILQNAEQTTPVTVRSNWYYN